MEKNKYPKVLVVSINAWRDNTGINTLIEFFKNWKTESIAQIYTRSMLPKTNICNKFFSISESNVVKSVFVRSIKTGKEVENEKDEPVQLCNDYENKMYSKNKNKFIRKILWIGREFAWKIGRWKSNELNEFLDNYDADVLFLPIYPTIYMCRIQKYVMKYTKKCVISYIADDNYTYKAIEHNPIDYIHRFILRRYISYIIKNSNQLMVISPKQKEEYDQLFNVNSIVFTKGVDFGEFKENEIKHPIKMVYTGKLIIGRWNSLKLIANALGEINKNEIKIELDIYTTDTLTKEQSIHLNKNGCTVKGAISQDKVQEVQSNADILVFVESLEKRYRNIARLSFSTKITDYLKSGKCIFAIGGEEIAPIDYFIRNDSAITAVNNNEVLEKLKMIVESKEIIHKYGKKAFDCGIKNHQREKNDRLLYEVISNAVK